MAALGELVPLAHGGTTGAVIELALALGIVAVGLAAWLGTRNDKE
jgi:hypothetical protein